jgi:alkylation response protein AidB-like acyl-CoA dehydrogenase
VHKLRYVSPHQPMNAPQPFYQTPPELEDPYASDRVLKAYLARIFSANPEHLAKLQSALSALSAVIRTELYPLQLADRLNEPKLTQWDPWGHRIDQIDVSPLWKRAAVLAAEHGLVATGYEREYGALSRVAQFALVYLFAPACDVYTCPLAMTDGAARTLEAHNNKEINARVLPRLTSRDPAQMWTSGQWMTERTGGSDVSRTETIARKKPDGTWSLSGTKWFTSAATGEMTLTLARPENNPPGGRGLALFYIELRDEKGRLRNIQVNRLKDKLGTKKVPTAELTLSETPAELVLGPSDGVRAITPMLNVTRTWNAICATGVMRRSISLARDYARKRVAFGEPLADKPLHLETIADMQCEFEAAFCLTFRVAELLGADDMGANVEPLMRVMTPLAKLMTGKQAVAVTSETLECFGGAGYVEDTGLPTLLRDAQVLPIWEGTTNVLSLDVLKALAKPEVIAALVSEVALCVDRSTGEARTLAESAQRAMMHALEWSASHSSELRVLEGGARRIAMTLARSIALALLCEHASWTHEQQQDGRSLLAARRFFSRGIDLIADIALPDARSLAMDLQ